MTCKEEYDESSTETYFVHLWQNRNHWKQPAHLMPRWNARPVSKRDVVACNAATGTVRNRDLPPTQMKVVCPIEIPRRQQYASHRWSAVETDHFLLQGSADDFNPGRPYRFCLFKFRLEATLWWPIRGLIIHPLAMLGIIKSSFQRPWNLSDYRVTMRWNLGLKTRLGENDLAHIPRSGIDNVSCNLFSIYMRQRQRQKMARSTSTSSNIGSDSM
jgi:hypothetical protein